MKRRTRQISIRPMVGQKEYEALVRKTKNLEKKARMIEEERVRIVQAVKAWARKFRGKTESHRIVQSIQERPNYDLCFISGNKLCVMESLVVREGSRTCVYRCITRPTE